MKINYPPLHQKIVHDLLEGKFLLYTAYQTFDALKKNDSFYIDFFKSSFGYELIIKNEFAYLHSDKTDETLSRNFTVFLAILCYEINKKNNNVNVKTQISDNTFSLQEVEQHLKNNNFQEVLEEIKLDDLNSFLKKLERRNIIEYRDGHKSTFKFTKAVNLFFDFAIDLAQTQAENEKEESEEDN
jgi:hypothetical protein